MSLLRQLYARDLRRPFCPEDHWISRSVQLSLDNPSDLTLRRRGRLRHHYRLFNNLPSFTREDLGMFVPPTVFVIYILYTAVIVYCSILLLQLFCFTAVIVDAENHQYSFFCNNRKKL